MKNIKHEVVWLMNDDKETPTKLVGKKVVPILQLGDEIMMESMDICHRIDSDPKFGPVNMFGPATSRFSEWTSASAEPIRRLLRPRHVLAPLPEFCFRDARQTFIANHPYKSEPFDYQTNLDQTSEYLAQLQGMMPALESLLYSPEHASEGGLCDDDIDLFGKLRSLTIIKDLQLPSKVKAYIEHMAATSEIPLYYPYAV